MNNKHKFSAGSVLGWLFFLRETLLELFYKVSTSPSINVLDICGRQRLQTLSLCEYTINGVEPNFQRFPCLTSLSLKRVSISAEDLNSLLLAFPKLERLELSNPIIRTIDDAVDSVDITIKLHCPTFKSLVLKNVEQSKFILENGCIECVDVNHCYFGSFKVRGSKSLTHFKFVQSEAQILDIEEGDKLEVLEFVASHVNHSNLFPMKIHTPRLRTFRIWGFSEAPDCGFEIDEERSYIAVDSDQISACSPQLRHLAIFFEGGERCDHAFGGLSYMENVVLLEIGWDSFDGFWELVEKVLKYCPNVRKLVVHGMVPRRQDEKFLELFGQHTTSMVETMRKYQHIQLQILYSYDFDSSNPLTDRWLLL
ncbi:unnamed protein product [Cuscuta campestris]|uniref:F-box/LRR-repeat protein 15/At3g58940/PEG3-like LRR domain-containing protein n=1 Tax=Cuscuta campestris TaxID=132261 RepID=A0A484LXW4_9ASTE|nr:unnamed protein product [Cuscuta campestris]